MTTPTTCPDCGGTLKENGRPHVLVCACGYELFRFDDRWFRRADAGVAEATKVRLAKAARVA